MPAPVRRTVPSRLWAARGEADGEEGGLGRGDVGEGDEDDEDEDEEVRKWASAVMAPCLLAAEGGMISGGGRGPV